MIDSFIPSYLQLLESGNSEMIIQKAFRHLENCDCCPRECGINRFENSIGGCNTGLHASISSYGPHFGEETPLSGWRGSGTIFFTRCNMHCVYCQNYDISQTNSGSQMTNEEIASIMINLQRTGCHNINLVSPSHIVPQIIEAVYIAAKNGLHIPIVYNSGGYDSPDMIELLNSIIDIYMPDMKYADDYTALQYSKVQEYTKFNQIIAKKMHKQVGDLVLDENGIAVKGLIIRHLILPNQIPASMQIIDFIASELSKNTYLNLMNQYHPQYQAYRYPGLNRKITQQEYQSVINYAYQSGLSRID